MSMYLLLIFITAVDNKPSNVFIRFEHAFTRVTKKVSGSEKNSWNKGKAKPSGNGTFVCKNKRCEEFGAYGQMDRSTCEKSCSNEDIKKDFVCLKNKCLEMPGKGYMDRPTCAKTCLV